MAVTMDLMHPVLVVGGGISGVSCARVLTRAGVDVVLLDRGRRLGGRMAVRTVDERAVDIGASYLTAGDDDFAAVVADWADRGLARAWTDTFDVVDSGRPAGTKQGAVRWAAPGGLRALVEDLARGVVVRQAEVAQVAPGTAPGHLLVDGRPARAVVLAMPDPQARRLMGPGLPSRSVLGDAFAPVLALSAGWDRRVWSEGFDGAFVNGDDHLTWVADDGRRRGDGAPVLVAHSTGVLAARHLDSPQRALEPMLAALRRVLDIGADPVWTHLHRWSFAHPQGRREATHHLGEDGVGFCGDAWSDRPRVEAAYLSGAALGRALVSRLG
jgi:renalase